ncbi:MAG TPA: hypothetical protein VMV86_06210 [Methanosarcinales archaeon]|nr:hypothetical protein [Methanosarcinales archaeon]
MSRGKGSYNWFQTGFPMVSDNTNSESLVPMYPIMFYDDFLGADVLFTGTTTAECGAKWATRIVGGGVVGKVADGINGIASCAMTTAAALETACLNWNDQESLSLNQGLVFEARVAIDVLPTMITSGTTEIVWGLAGAYNVDQDTVDCNAWFRVQEAANTTLLWETDDNVTDDDDNDTGIVLVAGTYHIYRIDASDITAVKFYVDGALVGTGSMAGLVTPIWCVQPYFNASKTNAGNVGEGTMLIDYVKVFQDRS